MQVRAGLRVLFEDTLPLGGAPTQSVTADVAPVSRAAAARGITGLFRADGISTVAGRAALLPRRLVSEETVEEATTAGALAVLVDGRLPAGAFSLDVPVGVPVVGLPAQLVGEIRAMLAAGVRSPSRSAPSTSRRTMRVARLRRSPRTGWPSGAA